MSSVPSESSRLNENTWKTTQSNIVDMDDIDLLAKSMEKMQLSPGKKNENSKETSRKRRATTPTKSPSPKSRKSKTPSPQPKKPTTRRKRTPVKQLSPAKKEVLQKKLADAKLVNVMKLVCPDSGYCLSISSEYSQYINSLFHDFTDFSTLSSTEPHQYRLLSRGASGFVNELYFVDKSDQYSAATILKSSIIHQQNRKSDSLMYEGLVGLYYINELCKKYPCLLETYGVYRYTNNTLKRDLMENNKITPHALKNGMNPIILSVQNKVIQHDGKKIPLKNLYNSTVVKEMTTDTDNICVLVQHVKKAQTMREFIYKLTQIAISNISHDEPNITNTLIHYFNCGLMTNLYQVYSILAHISDNYTHNDLHDSNVLIYSLENKFIRMTYHYPNGKEVSFFTNHMAKIIDYGRNYVGTDNLNSKCLYDSICQYERERGIHAKLLARGNKKPMLPEFDSIENYLGGEHTDKENPESPHSIKDHSYTCEPNKYESHIKNGDDERCGAEHGFHSFWQRILDPKIEPYISMQRRNKSADLLLLSKIAQSLFTSPTKLLLHGDVINNYMKVSTKFFFHQVLSLYEDERIGNTEKIRYHIVEEMRNFIITNPAIKSNITHSTTRADVENYILGNKKIMNYMKKTNEKLYNLVVDFYTNIPTYMTDIYSAHDNIYQKHIELEQLHIMERNEKNSNTKNQILMQIQIVQSELIQFMHNYHRIFLSTPLGETMYKIKEYDNNHKSWNGIPYISNVEKAAAQLEKYITTHSKCEKSSLDYFMKNLYVAANGYTTVYEYAGELHVYLDGSERQTHFDGVEEM